MNLEERILNIAEAPAWYDSRELRAIALDVRKMEERIKQLEDWKQSALAVEREWNANAIATMLGGKLGESQREVIQREVPKLLERIKRLEAVVNDPHALWTNWLRGDVKLPAGIGDVRQYQDHIKRLEEAGDALLELCEADETKFHLADQIDARCEVWRKAKEVKP